MLASAEIYPFGAELGGTPLLRRAGEDVRTPGDLETDEPCGDDRRLELCLQQSAGDSTLPEVDVPFRAGGERLLDEDVADLEAAAGAEHAVHLS